MPRLGRALRILACMLSLTAIAGCGNACRSLAEQICQCLPDDGTRTACNQRARDAESVYAIRAEDSRFCQQQLDSHACDCNKLNTVEGRQACGVAFQVTP